MAHGIEPPLMAAIEVLPRTVISTHLYRVAVGGLGGIAATCVKYLSQHHEKVSSLIENDQWPKAYAILFGLAIFAAVLFFLGGLIGWASKESHSLKLLALGISAPALVTTWASARPDQIAAGQADKIAYELHSTVVQTAQASETNIPKFILSTAENSYGLTILDGLNDVLGRDAISPNYWVVVGSFLELENAVEHAKRINSEAPDMKAFVGKRKPGNKFYPVIVGKFTNREGAEALLAKAQKLKAVTKVYLSEYADR